ncbi:MAG: Hsp20/alpha crystallin family protein [Thermoplasmata archaeon]
MSKKKKEKKEEKLPVKIRKYVVPPRSPRWGDVLRRTDEDFEDFWTRMERDFWEPGAWGMRPWGRRWPQRWPETPLFDIREPLVDIRDTGREIVVEAEMAGIPKENIDINLTEDSIEIRGETELREEEEDEGYYRRERSYSTCFRQMPLPAEVIPDKAKATLEGGILRIDIPKKKPTPKKKGHKVRIK